MKQYRIAIIEDDPNYTAYLEECLTRYGAAQGYTFAVKTFSKGENFLDNYRQVYDLVFMDIELGKGFLNGMDCARKLREYDPVVLLIFVTNMLQYAPEGYGRRPGLLPQADQLQQPVGEAR